MPLEVHSIADSGEAAPKRKLERTTFRTSRLLDFFSEKELTAQIGHDSADWPLVNLKELIDNATLARDEIEEWLKSRGAAREAADA